MNQNKNKGNTSQERVSDNQNSPLFENMARTANTDGNGQDEMKPRIGEQKRAATHFCFCCFPVDKKTQTYSMFDKSQAPVNRGSLPYAVIVGRAEIVSSRTKSTATRAKFRAGKMRAHVLLLQRLDGFTEA